MQLYFSPGACSLASHITALEAGVPVKLERADTKTKKLVDGSDYYAVNSKGAVPALKLDDGQVLTEGVAIMQYLADQKPESKLVPAAGTFERYRVQEWLNYITSEVHKSYSPLWNPNADPKVKEYTQANLEKKLDWINGQLAGKQYPHRQHLHRGRRVPVHGDQLELLPGHEPRQVARAQGIPRARRRTSESAGSVDRRRPEQESRLTIIRTECTAAGFPDPRPFCFVTRSQGARSGGGADSSCPQSYR